MIAQWGWWMVKGIVVFGVGFVDIGLWESWLLAWLVSRRVLFLSSHW